MKSENIIFFFSFLFLIKKKISFIQYIYILSPTKTALKISKAKNFSASTKYIIPSQHLRNKKQMTDYLEIQEEEIRVLEAIYLNDIKILKSSPPFKFEILVKPYLSSYDDISQEQYNALVTVDFVKLYPSKKPKIDLEPISNITQDNLTEIELLLEKMFSEQKSETPCIYDIVEAIRV